jgi:hypothetical protein
VSVNPFESGVAATPEVVVPAVGDRILAALGAGLASQAGPLLGPLVRALAAELVEVSELVAEGRGVESLFNLDESPRPGWLGQFVGVDYDPDTTREQQIAAVRSRGVTRGTPAAVVAAARATLHSSTDRAAVVELIERDGSAYRFTVRTYAVETPDAAATLAAIRAVKPLGLVVTHTVLAGRTFAEAISYGGSFGMLRDSGLTFGGYLRTLPDHRDEQSFAALAGAGTFLGTSGNTFARRLRPHEGRDRQTTVRTYGRLATRSYGALRAITFESLSREGA